LCRQPFQEVNSVHLQPPHKEISEDSEDPLRLTRVSSFNEADDRASAFNDVKDIRRIVRQWRADVAMCHHALDTRHLVSVSFSNTSAPRDISGAAGIDLMDLHPYTNQYGRRADKETEEERKNGAYSLTLQQTMENDFPQRTAEEKNGPDTYAEVIAAMRTEYPDDSGELTPWSGVEIPAFIGEFSREPFFDGAKSPEGANSPFANKYATDLDSRGRPLYTLNVNDHNWYDARHQDPYGILLHNRMWAAVMSGGAGVPAAWTDFVDQEDFHDIWDGIHEFLTSDSHDEIDFLGGGFEPVYPKVAFGSSKDFGDYVFERDNLHLTHDWKAPDNSFTVHPPGILEPSQFSARIAPVLYSVNHWEGKRNPPTFNVDCPQEWTFEVKILKQGDLDKGAVDAVKLENEATLLVTDGGTSETPQTVVQDVAYPFEVSSASTTVKAENSDDASDGHFWVEEYRFKNYVPPLRVYALQGLSGTPNMILGWVHNRQHNVVEVTDWDSPPTAITDATIHFTGLPNGVWSVKWFNPHANAGQQWVGTGTATASGGNLALTQSTGDSDAMPTSIQRDFAFIMTK